MGVALTVYQYPGCSTCKRALAWLRAKGIAFESIDIVKTPPSSNVLARVRDLADAPVKRLFNVAGESYRAGDFKSKLPAMTDDAALAALAADGKLVKRPLAISRTRALIGFDEVAWAAALL